MARIVLINDEEDLLEMCKIILESEGYSADVATSPSRAVELAAEADLVLLDLVMPGTSGEEVFQDLRRTRDTATVPVVIMSALVDGRQRSLALGAEAFLGKPFEPDTLLRVVAETLRAAASGARSRRSVDGSASMSR